MRNLLIWTFLSLGAFACGRDEDKVEISENDPQGNLHFSSASELADGSASPGNYLVAFRNLLDNSQLHFAGQQRSALAHFEALSQTWAKPSLISSIRYFSSLNLNQLSQSFRLARTVAAAPFLQMQPQSDERLASLTEINFRSEEEARTTLAGWYAEKKIWYAEPNFSSKIEGELEDTLLKNFGGENVNKVAWLEQINFSQAIEELAQLPSQAVPLIAVLDSGVDVEHPNLKDAIYINESGENKLGCVNDKFGCNVLVAKKDKLGDGNVFPTGTKGYSQECPDNLGKTERESSNFAGSCSHGTHVAGIIGGRGSKEFSGVCPYCKILVVRIVDDKNFKISDAAQLAAYSYVASFQDNGQPLVRVINASIGKFQFTRSLELFVKALKNYGRGVLTIGAAGNDDTIRKNYPAAFEDALAVSNVMGQQKKPVKSPSSNFGMWVDIAAPGDLEGACGGNSGILSTLPGGGLGCKVGTSMASPVVAGVAGLILVKEPLLTAQELEDRLKTTAIPDELYRLDINNSYRPTINGSIVPLLGSGVVNALGALRPDKDLSPGLSTDRSDRVEPGCGVIGSRGKGHLELIWLWLFSPLLIVWLGRKKCR